MAITAAVFRADKRCGKSGIPDNAKCTKQTSAKAAGIGGSGGAGIKEMAFKAASVLQAGRAAGSYFAGDKTRALRQITSAGKNLAEYAQEKGERTGDKTLLAFATGKNIVEAHKAFQKNNFAEAANTALEAYSFNKQRQGKSLSTIEELNRGFGDTLQVQKWLNAIDKNYGINNQTAIPKAKAAWRNKSSVFKPKRPKKPTVTGRSTYRGFKRSLLDSITAGDFRGDKRCGKSGIPDTAKCTKTTRQLTRTKGQLKPEEVARLSKSQIRYRERTWQGKPSDEEFARRLLTPGTRTRSVAQGYLSAPTGGDWRSKHLKEGIKQGRKNPAPKGSSEAAMHELRKRELLNRRVKFVGTVATAGAVVATGGHAARKEANRQRATIAEAQRIAGSSNWRKYMLDSITAGDLRDDACWKGYVQKGTKRKGNRIVPNCVPVGKAKAEVKRKTGQDGEDKLTSAKRSVWAEGFEAKKTPARR